MEHAIDKNFNFSEPESLVQNLKDKIKKLSKANDPYAKSEIDRLRVVISNLTKKNKK